MVKGNVTIEGARIIFRDFSGEKNKYNNDKTFGVVLEPDLAERLKADGWPVRFLEPRNEDESGLYFMNVKVAFGKIPPQIVMISGGTKKELTEETVNILDWANFANVDLKISPFNYDVNGHQGVKPYLRCLWVTLAEDDLEAKYRNIPYANEPVNDEEGLPFA